MKLLNNQNDFECVGMVAKHCDFSKLCIAEDESINFDLSGLFCDFWEQIKTYWEEVDVFDADPESTEPEDYELKKNLIYGGSFLGCNNSQSNHLGIKRILVYYTYARYVIINGFNDTPVGVVQKTNDFSIPKTIKELELFADKYRTMGYESFKKTLNFICHNRTVFSDFNHKDCSKCGYACERCKGGTKAKGYGIKSSIISR